MVGLPIHKLGVIYGWTFWMSHLAHLYFARNNHPVYLKTINFGTTFVKRFNLNLSLKGPSSFPLCTVQLRPVTKGNLYPYSNQNQYHPYKNQNSNQGRNFYPNQYRNQHWNQGQSQYQYPNQYLWNHQQNVSPNYIQPGRPAQNTPFRVTSCRPSICRYQYHQCYSYCNNLQRPKPFEPRSESSSENEVLKLFNKCLCSKNI